MKKMIIAWILIAACLFGTIYFIGIRVNKEYKEYRDYEADIIESATVFLNINDNKLKDVEKRNINIEELLKSNTLSTNKVNDDECTGYVTVKNNGGEYDYKAYIKCKNYISVDYKE